MTEQDLNSGLSVSKATITTCQGPELECTILEFRRERSCHLLPLPAQIPLLQFLVIATETSPLGNKPSLPLCPCCSDGIYLPLLRCSCEIYLARLFHPPGSEMVV